MAVIQLNTQILKAISSNAYFTRVDEQKQISEDKDLIQIRPKLFEERLSKFDSPNNVKGVFITTSGIYVETYNGYGVVNPGKETGAKHVGNRIHFDKDVNKQWSQLVNAALNGLGNTRFIVNNNWLFDPVLQNLKYIYFDDVLAVLENKSLNNEQIVNFCLYEIIVNASGQKGKPNRQTFPRLSNLMYIQNLGAMFDSPNGLSNIQAIAAKNKENWGLELVSSPSIHVRFTNIDMSTLNEWGQTQTDIIGRPDIYLYDKLFISDILNKQKKEKIKEEQQRKEAEQKEKKEGYGITGFLDTKEKFGDIIKDYLVDPVSQAYKVMLKVGFGGPKQNDGILTRESGWVYLGHDQKFKLTDRNKRIKAQTIWQALEYGLKKQGKKILSIKGERDTAAARLEIPEMYQYFNEIAKMAETDSIIPINYGYNSRLIKGYVENCKINAQYDEKVLNDSKQKITSWDGMQLYIQKSLTDAVVVQLIKSNIVSVGNDNKANEFEENNKVRDYCIHLRKAFCYGIYVQNQYQMNDSSELVQQSIRCCFPSSIDIEQLMQDFKTQIPNQVDVKAQNKGNEYSTVYFIVKYTKDNENKSMIPATKALEAIKEQGELPSWSHALLGEKDDETPFYWDQFMSKSDNTPFKRAYQIYAGSRSGKGILTNTLICNAIANRYKVFYVDGKPDTGISLGHIAWKEGKEAFVFDGMRAGSGEYQPGMLEKYTHGLRSSDEWASGMVQIPAGLQQFSDLIQKVTTYYRCIELVFKLISYRAGEGKATVGPPEEDWCVFVIDECAEMANQEKNLRNAFKDYVATSGAKKIPGTNIPFKPENAKDSQKVVWNDELQFIRNWLDWMASIASSVTTATTMNLGPSQSNVFFIFQGSGWMQRVKETTMVNSLMQLPTTKILGRGSIETGASSQYGNAATSKFTWADYINRPLSWVITTKQSVNSCDKEEDVRKFKPYQLWGNTEAQMLGGEPDTFRNIQFYVRELEKTFGFSAADVLESAYDYADRYTNKHNGLSVKDYVYRLNFLTADSKCAEHEKDEDEFDLNENEQVIDFDTDEQQSLPLRDSSLKMFGEPSLEESKQREVDHSNYNESLIGVKQNPVNINKEHIEQFVTSIENPRYKQNEDGTLTLSEEYSMTEVLNNSNAVKSSGRGNLLSCWLRSKIPETISNSNDLFADVSYNLMIGSSILYEIANAAGQQQRVIDLQLVNNRVIVNKKLLSFTDAMTNPLGQIDLPSSIKFRKLFKKFKNMKYLKLDSIMYEELLNEYERYGGKTLEKVFEDSKKLLTLEIVSSTGKQKQITRSEALKTTYKKQEERKVKQAFMSKNQKAKVEMKNKEFLGRAGQTIKQVKDEAWGTPTKKALTTVTTLATVGFIGLAAGPVTLIGWSLFSNYMIRKLYGSVGKD